MKRAYLREKVKEKIIVPVHMDTERMPADMLTKSMNRKLLTRHMERIGMIRIDKLLECLREHVENMVYSNIGNHIYKLITELFI